VRGRFVALEGVDGSGKTTHAAMLADALRAGGREVVAVREPGGTALGEGVRTLLLDGGDLAPWTEALLFAAARAQLVQEVIRPALAAGRWVVADRFVHSSLAYQGAARGLGVDAVWAVNAPGVDGCLPDLVAVLDIDPAEAAARGRGRRRAADRIEREGEALQRAVAAGYLALIEREPQRVVAVPAHGSTAEVHERLMAAVGALA
jgi:dTMP kinase